MKKVFFAMILVVVCSILAASPGFAHTPLCSCYNNGDGTVTCEGGFSDGSSAAGVEMRVVNAAQNVLIKGKMDEDSEFTFDIPKGPYKVQFDAGPGHLVEVEGKDITE
ncbi:MAG: hypothetical protein J7M20_02540 [Deltaproteobacteria bacterium]|nr:hypothetical protein [Deltaproteobacteria bacterium]